MTDIVERLDQELKWIICSDEHKLLLSDAKAEIERLREWQSVCLGTETIEVENLKAEIERLRGRP